MAESTLSITLTELLAEVAAYLGYGVDSTAWTNAQKAELDRYVQAGVRQFYYPPEVAGVEPGYEWSFLNPTTTLTTTANDAAQDLPDDVGRVTSNFFFAASVYRPSVIQVSEGQMLAMLSRSTDTAAPLFACVRSKAQVAGAGQRLDVAWWPIPDAAYTLTYRYEAYSGKLTEANPYPLGGMRHAELLVESCLAIAEQRANDARGQHYAAFEALLRAGVAMDRQQGARHFGAMSPNRESVALPRRGDTGSSYDISYKGVEW